MTAAPSPLLNLIAARLTAVKNASMAMATLISPSVAITVASILELSQTEYLLHFDCWSEPRTVQATLIARDLDVDFAVFKLESTLNIDLPPRLLSETEPPMGATWECFYITPATPDGGYVFGKVDGREIFQERKHLRLIPADPPPFERVQGLIKGVQGISGAPVIVGEQLIGVVARVNQSSDRWYAIPVAEMMKSSAWEAVREAMAAPSGSSERRDQTDELDEAAFFRRLSQSSLMALRHADGIRRVLGQGKMHMEHFIAGLFQKSGGPTRKALSEAGIDRPKLLEIITEVVETSIPPEGAYVPSVLSELPPVSKHVNDALIAARNIADAKGSKPVRSRHLIYGALSVSECSLIKALLDNGVDKEKIQLDDKTPQKPQKPRAWRRQANAGIRSDDPEGEDLLDITQEVEALCTVLAAKDVEPPLSLGLFGDWGSGKSFFMRKMEKRFDELKEVARKGDSDYCSNIVQLWFNAWHYMDTSLWASLATEIFDGLAQALAKQEALAAGSKDPDYERAQLVAQSVSTNDALARAQQEKQAVEAELRASQQQLASIQSGETVVAASPQAVLREAYRFAVQQPEVLATVENAEQTLNQEVERAAQELNISAASAATDTMKEQLLELQGLWGYVRAIILAMRNTKNIWRWLISVAVFLAMVVGLVWLLPRVLGYDSINTALVRFVGALLAILAAVAPFIPGVRKALRIIDGAIKSNQELIEQTRRAKEKKLQRHHQELQQKATEAQQNVEKMTANAKELKEKLYNLRSDRQMSNFIRQRQQSTDYTKYQGVIAKARSDFEQLSTLLAKEKERYTKRAEERRKREQAVAQEGQPEKAGDGAPEGQQSQAAEDEWLLPRIDRIILYIDDLDRCPENKVVEVLQAVHLLLAFPLFVVVVGVDPRWLLHSLRQHSNVFRDQMEEEGDLSEEERTHWQSTPLNYLEKIFQIPFTLWPMERAGFAKMVDNLTAQPPKAERKNVDAAKTTGAEKQTPERPEAGSVVAQAGGTVVAPDGVQRRQTTPAGVTAVAADASNPAQGTVAQVNPQQTQTAVGQDAAEPPVKIIDPHPEHLQIKPWEREFMKKMHQLIPSPRATKRFINVYRLIRASVDIDDEEMLDEFVGDEKQGEYRAVLLLLAILIGYPDQATEILRDLLEQKRTETWWEFIDSFKARTEKREAAPGRNGDVTEKDGDAPQSRSATKRSAAAGARALKSSAVKASADKNSGTTTENGATANTLREADAERWLQLLEKLKMLQPLIDDQSCGDFVKWAPKVARYSFQSGRVLLMQSVTGPDS